MKCGSATRCCRGCNCSRTTASPTLGAARAAFVGLLKDAAGLATTPTCVDPSASMLEACERKDVAFVQSDARAYVDGLEPKKLDRVLLKEVVHHFADDELASICAGLHKTLDQNGRVVVCTRPRDDVEYPFFEAARAVWRAARRPRTTSSRPSGSGLRVRRGRGGLPGGHRPGGLARDDADRFWSTFAGFSDGELEAGVAEVAAAHPPGPIAFEERVVFIVAEVV